MTDGYSLLREAAETSSQVMLGGGPFRMNLALCPGLGLKVKYSIPPSFNLEITALRSAAPNVRILSPPLTYSKLISFLVQSWSILISSVATTWNLATRGGILLSRWGSLGVSALLGPASSASRSKTEKGFEV